MGKPDDGNGDLASLEVDQVLVGRVVSLENYGAYVALTPGIVGLVLIPEISWRRIRHPGDVLTVGEEARAKVLVANRGLRKVSLSIRGLLPSPHGG
jgi:small subunit ribosomal protein S1